MSCEKRKKKKKERKALFLNTVSVVVNVVPWYQDMGALKQKHGDPLFLLCTDEKHRGKREREEEKGMACLFTSPLCAGGELQAQARAHPHKKCALITILV